MKKTKVKYKKFPGKPLDAESPALKEKFEHANKVSASIKGFKDEKPKHQNK